MMTIIGIVAGNILNLLENKSGALSVTDIRSELNYPEEMIYMAIGSLVRDGYVRMTVEDGEQYLFELSETSPFSGTFGEIAYAP